MLNNKKSQLNDPDSFSLINPVFIIGVIVFCSPIIYNLYNEMSSLLSLIIKIIGIILIFGGFLIMMMDRKEMVDYGY